MSVPTDIPADALEEMRGLLHPPTPNTSAFCVRQQRYRLDTLLRLNAHALLRAVEENQQVRSVLFNEVATPETTLPQQAAAYVALVGRCKQRIKELDDTLLINQQYYTQQLDQFLTPLRKRIAELEAQVSLYQDTLKKQLEKLNFNFCTEVQMRERIAKLEQDAMNNECEVKRADAGWDEVFRLKRELDANKECIENMAALLDQVEHINDLPHDDTGCLACAWEKVKAGESMSEKRTSISDNPEFDGADAAHPAWWRGNDAGVKGAVIALNKKLDNPDLGGVFGDKDLEALWQRIRQRIAKLEGALRQVQPDTQHYKDGAGGCCIDCPYCTIEEVLKGGGK